MHFSKIFFIFITSLLIEVSDSRDAILDVMSFGGTGWTSQIQFCVQYNGVNQTKTPSQSAKEAATYYVIDLTPMDGCSQNDYNQTKINNSMTMIIILSGNCETVHQATIAEKHGASVVIVVSDTVSGDVPVPTGSRFSFKALAINVFTISQNDFRILSSMIKTKTIQAKIFRSYTLVWDHSVLVMALMSTVLVVLGGKWAASENNELLQIQNEEKCESADENQSNLAEDVVVVVRSQCQHLGDFCILIVLITLTVIFIINFTVYLTIVVFCIIGMVCLYHCLRQIFKGIFPTKYYNLALAKITLNNSSRIRLGPFLLFSLAVALVMTWVVIHTTSSSWILQNIIGAAICVDGSRIIAKKYNSLASVTKWLSLFLIYDQAISFVIPPRLTDGGDTLIESLTTGGNEELNALFPMMFKIPQIEARQFSGCGPRPYTVLKLWNFITAGVLVSFCAICDIQLIENSRQHDQGSQQQNTKIDPVELQPSQQPVVEKQKLQKLKTSHYMLASSVGYSFGVTASYKAGDLFDVILPKSTFIIPFTMAGAISWAMFRGEVCNLWNGKLFNTQEPAPINDIQSENDDDDQGGDIDE